MSFTFFFKIVIVLTFIFSFLRSGVEAQGTQKESAKKKKASSCVGRACKESGTSYTSTNIDGAAKA